VRALIARHDHQEESLPSVANEKMTKPGKQRLLFARLSQLVTEKAPVRNGKD
jgi:hypothetical protein